MSANIEALYIYDDQRIILDHIYGSRPPSSRTLITHFLAHPTPRPSLLQLPDLSPPTIVHSVSHANLIILCPSSTDVDSVAILEFLHKVIDIFEDFLGGPLLASKIEENYEVVAQLLNEICDGGIVCNTESNALKESVEVSSLLGKLFTQVGLPGSSPAIGSSNNLAATLKVNANLNSGPAIPWRRPNVRHTSNELYVDIVETLNVVLAPSGKPICATAAGYIAFTAKISGVPDLILTLNAPGGTSSSKSAGIARTMQLPTFHPCVRLAKWKEHPGELSFVPPDGRFMLAGYEVDLLPSPLNADQPPSQNEKIFLPVSVDLRTGLGPSGSDFEARLTLNTSYPGVQSQSRAGPSRSASSNPFSFGSASGGSSSMPTLEMVSVTIPFAANVRSVVELKASRGEANYLSWNKTVEWKVPTKEGSSINGVATLTGSLVGPIGAEDIDTIDTDTAEQGKTNSLLGYYDEDSTAITQQHHNSTNGADKDMPASSVATQQRRSLANKALMPRSALVSFTIRGWLPSGIKVDSLHVDVKKSKGLGEGVKPFKGVKYVTVSKQGVERRA